MKYDYEQPDYDKIFAELDSSQELNVLQKQYLERLPLFAAKPIYKLDFSHNSPHFSHYEVMADNREWKKIEANSFSWNIKEIGTHTFRVRLVDKYDKRGPESFVTIDYR